MNIPKSYEALAADLASEKILSKTLQGQKEAYMMLADSRKVELDAALWREAALREELETEKTGAEGIYQQLEFCQKQRDALQQRLTVAEQRAPVAHESECTSCYGSGEYTDAIGDWRGYCTCPSGVEAEGLKGLKP